MKFSLSPCPPRLPFASLRLCVKIPVTPSPVTCAYVPTALETYVTKYRNFPDVRCGALL